LIQVGRTTLLLAALLIGALFPWIAWRSYASAKAIEEAESLRRQGDLWTPIEVLQAAIKRDPHNPDLWQDLGQSARAAWVMGGRDDRLQLALSAYREAGRLNPLTATPWQELGATLSLAGKHAQADAAFEKALARDPRNAGIIIARAQALENAGRPDRALTEFRRAARILPNDYSQQAETRLGTGRRE
jgi:tetratricopeptide (TPR) repeat protein